MKITIIVPVYNVEPWIRDCLESLDRQKFPAEDFEIVLVNDGSTDGSEAICKGFCERAPARFRLLTQTNAGLSAARNTGLDNARGEYVCFVDSDDWVSPDFLTVLYQQAAAGADIVVCGYTAHYADGRTENFSGIEKRASPQSQDLRRQVLLGPTFACNKMFRRALFDAPDGRFLPGVCYEDLGTVPLLVARAQQLAVTEAPIYHYRIGRPGAITTFRDGRILHIFITLRRLVELLPKEFSAELEWMALKACVFRYALVARCPGGGDFQRQLSAFMRETFPRWPRNAYYRRERARAFRLKTFLLRWNLGWLLRVFKR